MSIKCLIVDDEPKARMLIQDYIDQISWLDAIGNVSNKLDAIELIKKYQPQLLFLDIHLPHYSGLDIAKNLKYHAEIIFITAHAEHAVESYNLEAVDYLLKPVTFDRFLKAVKKVKRRLSTKDKYSDHFYVKVGNVMKQLHWSKILYIQAMREYVQIVSEGGKVMVYKRMKEMESLLPTYLIRVHNSWIVNLDYIRQMGSGKVWIGNIEIPVSRARASDLLQRMRDKMA
ncbi:LytR/AlgR family response regulator transcription factor [Portibacter marinus]|uniref:LytR/AlgR family response regulator transcription factor n=1 Tax=Portibacter marinus TaxID=2898660 RepID=UPI001F3457CC|nr:LytTR family DNA-binding domain-containing protein [Portibacter marinus]